MLQTSQQHSSTISRLFETENTSPPQLKPSDKINWPTSIPFISVHIASVVGFFFAQISWQAIALCIGLYYLRMFGVTAGYHRYFAHRSYKTSRIFQFFLALLATISVQKGVLWWAANHRHHHRNSDLPDDVHSPRQQGFIWSHVTWILAPRHDATRFDQIRDFTKYPELVWLNEHYLVPVVLYAIALFAVGGWNAFYWGFLVSTVLLWHGTFTVNSLAHMWGSRRYETTDDSRNNFWIALITMGEGWHNNHHHYMSSARQGFFWYEIDMSYYVLKLLSKLGIVWDLRAPPKKILIKNP